MMSDGESEESDKIFDVRDNIKACENDILADKSDDDEY